MTDRIEIRLSEDEGYDFVTSRGLAVNTTVLFGAKPYSISFISRWRLINEIDVEMRHKQHSALCNYEKYIVVSEVTEREIIDVVQICISEGSLSYYEANKSY